VAPDGRGSNVLRNRDFLERGPELVFQAHTRLVTLEAHGSLHNQVELMQIDTVASPERPGLLNIGISPQAAEEIIRQMASRQS
jgi:hypothetical protein